jgi:hypothetical protein
VIEWKTSPSGARYPVNLSAQQALDNLKSAVAAPYQGRDPALAGTDNLTAMNTKLVELAAKGDKEAINMVHNRLMGTPKQYIETVNVTKTMRSFLDTIATEVPPDGSPRPAEPA